MKKKRLLIVGPLPPPFAGPEIGTRFLLNSRTLNDEYEIQHIDTTLRKSNAERGQVDSTLFLGYTRYVFRLLWKLLNFRPDIVLYCVMSATKKGWVRDGTTLALCNICRVRPIMQFRGGHFRYFFDSLGSFPGWLIGGLIRRSRLVLAQADALKEQFVGIVPDSNIGRLYNCVTQEFFDRFEEVGRSTRSGPVQLLFVGHLSHAKGYCDLLKTLPYLMRKYDIELSCLGATLAIERNVFFNQATGERIKSEDPDQSFDRYIVREGLAERVHFLGDRVDGEAKHRIFEQADIFVLPSYSEGFSMAILEAMAAALPIVATKVGAAPEIIEEGETGFILIPGDVNRLKTCLEELIVDKQKRIEFGQRARKACRKHFVGDVGVRGLIQVLEAR